MTTWELFKECVNIFSWFDTVDGMNSITPKRSSGGRLMISDDLDGTSFTLWKWNSRIRLKGKSRFSKFNFIHAIDEF